MDVNEYRAIVDGAQQDYQRTLERIGVDIITEAAARVAITGYAFSPLDELHLRSDR